MVIIITLVALFGLFFFIKHRIGPAHLAVIAGLSIYEMFGNDFINFASTFVGNFSRDELSSIIYLALVAGFPLILYLRSKAGGVSGILRIAESALFAILLTVMVAPALSTFFTIDELANNIVSFLAPVENTVVLVGIIAAYIDILLYKD